MKIVTAHAMQELDRRAIEEFGIPGRDLMEQAGKGCAEHIQAFYGAEHVRYAVILAGKGNNGGDGYVIARYLLEMGWKVLVIILTERDSITGDAQANLLRLPDELLSFCPGRGEVSRRHLADLQTADLLIDALLGTGLSKDLRGSYRETVELINKLPAPVVSVDIPSGIHGTTGRVMGHAVRADLTITFAFAKLGHMLYPAADYVGELRIVDIGIPPKLMQQAVGYQYLTSESMASLVVKRDRQAHKGSYGHCLIVAGSTGKTGAAALAANSAVRTGAGLVTLAVPASLNQILEIKTTEPMTVPLPDDGSGRLAGEAAAAIARLVDGKAAVAVGPGLDRSPACTALVQNMIRTVKQPLVLDADALNALAEDTAVLGEKLSDSIVITPHPGEMSRLLGSPLPDMAAVRISVAQEFAHSRGIYVILKGARTVIAAPDGQVAINSSGNPGMASGGMGDTLTGIIVSLLGQGHTAWDACCLGVFLHGLAGDLVAARQGEAGMTATDLQQTVPLALNHLRMLNQTM